VVRIAAAGFDLPPFVFGEAAMKLKDFLASRGIHSHPEYGDYQDYIEQQQQLLPPVTVEIPRRVNVTHKWAKCHRWKQKLADFCRSVW
jgi:hypothetical protein